MLIKTNNKEINNSVLIQQKDSAGNDFQQRANEFESHSKWVKDDRINGVPKAFLKDTAYIGDLLDAGGGTGYLSWYIYINLMDKVKSIYLVDESEKMLEIAKKKENFPVIVINSSIESFCLSETRKFDTILVRQVLQYANDICEFLNSLKKMLNKNGKIYIGQIAVADNECRCWHSELMQSISNNRRRSFAYYELLNLFSQIGFEITRCEITDYEASINNLFNRSVDKFGDITLEKLMNKMRLLTTETLKNKMKIRFGNNDLYFTVKFCHFLLRTI